MVDLRKRVWKKKRKENGCGKYKSTYFEARIVIEEIQRGLRYGICPEEWAFWLEQRWGEQLENKVRMKYMYGAMDTTHLAKMKSMACLENSTRHENLPEIDHRPKHKSKKTAKLLKENKH